MLKQNTRTRNGGKLTRAGHTWLSPGLAKSDQHSTLSSLKMGKRNHQGFGIEIILRGSSCLISWKLVHPQSAININDSEDFLRRSVYRSAPRLSACLVAQLSVWVVYGLLVCLSRLSIVCLSVGIGCLFTVCLSRVVNKEFSTPSLYPW